MHDLQIQTNLQQQHINGRFCKQTLTREQQMQTTQEYTNYETTETQNMGNMHRIRRQENKQHGHQLKTTTENTNYGTKQHTQHKHSNEQTTYQIQ